MNKISGNSTATDDAPQDHIEAKNAFEVLVCTNTALRLAARRLGNLFDEALAPVGLKATQVSLLMETTRMAVANGGRAPTLQDLAAKLAIQISALTHALKPLLRDGLVELQADEQDRRTKRAVLTPAGTALLQEALVCWSTANQRVEEVLGAEAAASLRAVADYVASDEFLSAYMGN
ncbi:MarR family transcriptional regulator [Pseudomonas sp. dw_612]|uniref:MarR family winged helix-turn-helix transcriptional regulator n=1 Tax=Pseudomonas sp. dw_612 TaxID=2720080 RepID=UPI001BD5C060|nr:MarR family transcriptional regulator [Pseudomonas sp. dw_612]